MVLKAIDGTASKGKAPAPRGGLARAIYDTVNALGGATQPQIEKYLPAALSDGARQPTREQVKTALGNGRYRGYFISDKKYWRIAPLEYWQACREHRNRMDLKPHRKKKTKKKVAKKRAPRSIETKQPAPKPRRRPRVVVQHVEERPIWHWWVAASLSVTSFGVGVLLGWLIA